MADSKKLTTRDTKVPKGNTTEACLPSLHQNLHAEGAEITPARNATNN